MFDVMPNPAGPGRWRGLLPGVASPRVLRTALMFSLAACAPLPAQVVRGQVVADTDSQPIPGALIELLDRYARPVAAALSNGTGFFTIRAPGPGVYSVQVDRIGFERWTSPMFELGTDADRAMRLALSVRPVRLAPLRVSSADADDCEDLGENENVLLVWQEARKALRSAELLLTDRRFRFRISEYERVVEPDLRRVRTVETRIRDRVSDTPFESLSPVQLSAAGFVRGEDDGSFVYYAPDQSVLLSPEFLTDHCFGLRWSGGDGDRRVGLVFRPVKQRKLPEIAGTLWLDEDTGVLTSLEYRFVHLPFPVESEEIGGRVEFLRHAAGGVLVGRWYIRMPLPVEQLAVSGGLQRVRRVVEIAGFRERGGEVLGGSDAAGQPWIVPAKVRGAVFDSVSGGPLRGATIRFGRIGGGSGGGSPGPGDVVWAVSDAEGRYRMRDLADGMWEVTVSHPETDGLGWATRPVSRVTIVGETNLDIAMPTLDGVFRIVCPGEDPRANVGALVGRVWDGNAGKPIRGAVVTAAWRDRSGRWRRRRVRSEEDGAYTVCGIPGGVDVEVTATDRSPGYRLESTMRMDERVIAREIVLGVGRPHEPRW